MRVIRMCLAAMSLLLCVATAALGVRSFVVRDLVSRIGYNATQFLTSEHGQLIYSFGDGSTDGPRRAVWGWTCYTPHETPFAALDQADPGLRWSYHGLGFTWRASRGGRGIYWSNRPTTFAAQTNIGVPHALVAALLAIGPVLTLRRLRRDRRRRAGGCAACGYDLRASPGRCPECGTIPARRPEHARCKEVEVPPHKPK